jgi:tetratricopeptide (TPR) repeat protein
MPDDAVQFGRIAVERGYLLVSDFQDALHAIGKRRDANRLGAVLVDRGLLSPAQANEIAQLMAARAAADSPQADELIGLELGGCQILERIGEGSMGTTYRAHHTRLDRAVAVKVLHPRLVAIEGNLERFTHEARAAANLEHPSIVQVYDFDSDLGYHFIVMQYVEGQNLRELLASRGSLDPRQALWIGARVLEGLQHAHSRGIVHRDIKPANLLLTPEPKVKIADFGLVRIMTLTTSERISIFGEIIGTPLYMPPEQATGDEVDGRADLYALGISLFELIAGRVPFPGATTMEVLEQHCLRPLPQLEDFAPACSPGLQAFLERMCAKEVEDRYASAEEALQALQELRSKESSGPRSRGAGASADAPHDPSRLLEDAPPLVSEEALSGMRMRLRRRLAGDQAAEHALESTLASIDLNLTPATVARRAVEQALTQEHGAAEAVAAVLADLLARGRIDELLALAPNLESQLPTAPGVSFYVGQALAQQGRLDEAAARLSLATVLAPGHLPARLHLARTLVAVGREDDAVETLQEALTWHPTSVLLARRLAELLWVVQADATAALPVLERAVELAPTRPELRLQLGWALCELERYGEAEAVLHEGQAWSQDDPGLAALLAHARRGRLQTRDPQTTTLRLNETDLGQAGPGPVTSARLDAIRLAEASGRWGRALAVASSGLGDRPRSVPLLLAQGRAQAALGDHASAVESFGLALAVDPGNDEALQGLRSAQQARRGGA